MGIIQVNKLHTFSGHRDCVYTLERGRNDKDLFSAGGDGMVVHWNLENPEVGELVVKVPNSVYAIHYLSARDLLVVAQNFEGIHLIDYANKKELASLKISDAYLFDLNSDRNELMVACGDGSLVIVNLDSWNITHRIKASSSSARTVAINRTRGEMAVGYSDNYIRIFDLTTYLLKKEWVAHGNSVFTLSYSPNDAFLLSGSRDARLKIWTVAQDYGLSQEIAAHLYTINHINYSPDGKHFVTCSMDKSIKVWDAMEFKLLKVIDKARHAGHGTSVNKLAWTTYHNQLISASDDKTLSAWNIIF